jgi:hypothetical protein
MQGAAAPARTGKPAAKGVGPLYARDEILQLRARTLELVSAGLVGHVQEVPQRKNLHFLSDTQQST